MVRREAPSSARPGRKALVEADGTFRGWLGGSCIEPVVRREALDALRRRRPRLLIFSPDAESPGSSAASGPGPADGNADVARHPMTCHSGGTVEIFVEPQLPSPVLALFGDSPVNRALSAMGAVAGYAVRVVATPEHGADAEGFEAGTDAEDAQTAPELYAVVATMGDWDEDAVHRALQTGARYVGLVASPRRAVEIRHTLRDRGLEEASLEALSSPAGLDLGAEEPAEIAVTILAELIALRRGQPAVTAASTREDVSAETSPSPRASATATDPVCGMTVQVEEARHTLEHEGTTHFFCCGGCKSRFAADPEAYLDLAG